MQVRNLRSTDAQLESGIEVLLYSLNLGFLFIIKLPCILRLLIRDTIECFCRRTSFASLCTNYCSRCGLVYVLLDNSVVTWWFQLELKL